MVERRKIRDRRVNPPRQGLPLYYTRHIADRREPAYAAQRHNRQGLTPLTRPEV